MRDLGVELDGVEAARRIGHGDDRRVLAPRGGAEAGGELRHLVAVAHPDRLARREAGEEKAGRLLNIDLGAPVLAAVRAAHLAAQDVRHELHAVADAEDRDAEVEELRRRRRRPRREDALRPAGEDDADRREAADLRERQVEGVDLAVDAALAHPPRDELRELAAVVEDEEGLVARPGGRGRRLCRGVLVHAGSYYANGFSMERAPNLRPSCRSSLSTRTQSASIAASTIRASQKERLSL